jgi:glycosyltransferase involved in cell wall biosynthesis
MHPMKIFFVTPFNTGCSKWRAEIPAKYLQKRGHAVHFYEERMNSGCPDVIVFARAYTDNLLPLYQWAKSRKLRVVYDTDDAIDCVDKSNPAYAFSRSRLDQTLFMITNADAVTTTTPELADHLRQWNPVVAIIPNSIDPEEWTIHPRSRNRETRIGWAGGSTHYRDIALVMEALSDLQGKLNFKFIVHGLTSRASVKELYQSCLKSGGGRFRASGEGGAVKAFLDQSEHLRYEFKPYVETRDYVRSVCDLRFDIGLAPLADTVFNRHKSCVKYYEHAMSGAVTLASDVLPYSREVPDRCGNTPKEWKESLACLIDSDLSSRWKSQYEWTMTHRNIEHNVTLWENVLGGDFVAETPSPNQELVSR